MIILLHFHLKVTIFILYYSEFLLIGKYLLPERYHVWKEEAQ